jgi:hypothetical protein
MPVMAPWPSTDAERVRSARLAKIILTIGEEETQTSAMVRLK